MYEPRSFAPREALVETAAMKIDPITSVRPTNREIAEGVNQAHQCLEDGKAQNAREFKAIKADVRVIKQALGLEEGTKKVAGLSSPGKAWFRTFLASTASFGGLIVLWKIIATIAPAAALAFSALNAAILTGKF